MNNKNKSFSKKPNRHTNNKKPVEKANTGAKTLHIEVDKLNIDLFGVTIINDKPRLVKNAIPFELIEAEEEYVNGIGKVYKPVKIIEPSEFRVTPLCDKFEQCGNCNLLHMQYERQLREKTIMLKKHLRNVCDVYIDDCVASSNVEWRNKAHLVFSKKGKRTVVGFVNEESHKALEISECKMHGEWFSILAKILVKWAQSNALEPYIPEKHAGILRFAVARKIGDAIMLTIVSTTDISGKMDDLYSALCDSFKGVSLYNNINNQKNSMVFSDKFVHVCGEEKLNGSLLGVKYSLSPNSFLQTNEGVTEKIYSRILDIINKSGSNTVIDLYSGIGITSILFAKSGKDVISIESVKAAVEDAKLLAERNGVAGKIKMYCGDCKEILPRIKARNSVFFVDPPRRGLGASVCNDIIRFSPKTLVYLSCNPETLASDLSLLTRKGYRISSVTPYDMFPNTRHVETLVVLYKGRA